MNCTQVDHTNQIYQILQMISKTLKKVQKAATGRVGKWMFHDGYSNECWMMLSAIEKPLGLWPLSCDWLIIPTHLTLETNSDGTPSFNGWIHWNHHHWPRLHTFVSITIFYRYSRKYLPKVSSSTWHSALFPLHPFQESITWT